MSPQKPFWLVWNPGGTGPTKQHLSYSDAREEAIRLAAKYQGVPYIVLQSCTLFMTKSVEEINLKPAPF